MNEASKAGEHPSTIPVLSHVLTVETKPVTRSEVDSSVGLLSKRDSEKGSNLKSLSSYFTWLRGRLQGASLLSVAHKHTRGHIMGI